MSLETLILAADFLEWRSKTKTCGNDISADFSMYEKQVKTSLNSASTPSLPPLPPPPPPLPPSPPPPALSTLQPLPEQPATSTSSSPSFLTPIMTIQSPHNSSGSSSSSSSSNNSNNHMKSKNADKTDKRRAGGAGTREVHNKLEKNRRAHMKEMFEYLRSQIPQLEDKKNSNLSILRNAIRYIQTLRRKEKDHEVEVQKLAQNKIVLQEKLRRLKMDTSLMNIEFCVNKEPDGEEEDDTYSTSTASEGDGPIMSDVEEEDEDELQDNSQKQKDLERKATSVITCQALPTIIETASPRVTFASNSSVVSATTTLLSGSIKPLKNNISLPTTVITNNYVSATNITQNINSSLTSNHSTAAQRPVMEILHKTLAQRQAINKQFIGNSMNNARAEITSSQVSTIQATKTSRTATHLKPPQNSICSVIPLPTASVKPGLQSTGIKLATLTIPVNKPTKMAITPHKKIVVETSPASVPTGVSVTAALSSPAPSSPSASVGVSSATVPSALTAIVRTPTAHPIVSQTVPVVSAVKQIITPANSQIVSGSPLAVNPLLGQSLTRTQILNTSMLSSPSVSTSTTTSSNQISSMHPVMSLTPVSQLVSPAVHVPSGLPQTAQLNMFPIIQSQLFPTNQVVGQSVTAKPLVMVTVPTTTTVQVSVAMTPTTT